MIIISSSTSVLSCKAANLNLIICKDVLYNRNFLLRNELTQFFDSLSTSPFCGTMFEYVFQMINAALLGGTKEALNLAGGRASMFSSQTGRRSSSAREYTTPDFELVSSVNIIRMFTRVVIFYYIHKSTYWL